MGQITLEGVRKSFGATAVIKGADLDIAGRRHSSSSSAHPVAARPRSCA